MKDYDDITVTLGDGTIRRCIMSHYFIPLYDGHHYKAVHLHGHSHTSEEAAVETDIARMLNGMGVYHESYNVGCMYWNYEPVTLDEIIREGSKKGFIYEKKCEFV